MKPATDVFLTLSADGVDDADQRSGIRKAFLVAAALLVLLSAPLLWAVTAQGGVDNGPDAVLNKPTGTASGDDDDDGDDDTDSTRGAGDADGTRGAGDTDGTDRTRGDRKDTRTRGDTSSTRDRKTGRETRGKTDRRGLHTGHSTRGETDPGDKTGKTERR